MRFAPQTTLPSGASGFLWERLPAAMTGLGQGGLPHKLRDLAAASRG